MQPTRKQLRPRRGASLTGSTMVVSSRRGPTHGVLAVFQSVPWRASDLHEGIRRAAVCFAVQPRGSRREAGRGGNVSSEGTTTEAPAGTEVPVAAEVRHLADHDGGLV